MLFARKNVCGARAEGGMSPASGWRFSRRWTTRWVACRTSVCQCALCNNVPSQIEYIWPSRTSIVKAVYLFNRYLPIVDTTLAMTSTPLPYSRVDIISDIPALRQAPLTIASVKRWACAFKLLRRSSNRMVAMHHRVSTHVL